MSSPDVTKSGVARRLGWWLSSTSIVLALAALLTVVVGWVGLDRIERRSRGELEARLETEVDTSVLALQLWLDAQRSVARSWASEPEVRTEIVAFATSPMVREWDRDRVLASEELQRLRARLRPICEAHDYVGFLVIELDGRQIASLLDDGLGKSLAGAPLETMRRVVRDKSVVTLPFISSTSLPDEQGQLQPGRPTMLAAAPIYDAADAVVAVLAFQLRPEKQFAQALESGRPGETGETYAFDQHGLLLSDSRFNHHLRQIGLIPNEPTSRALLALELRDPGGNLLDGFHPTVPRDSLPLTRMAASAVAGGNEVDLAGYGDYRGVPVVGAWRWLSEYGFGVTHEIDLAEAYSPLHAIQRVFLGWLGLFAAALVTSTVLHIRRLQTERSRAQTQAELASLTNRFQVVLDSATQVSIIATDMSGIITVFNAGAERMLQYRAEEVIGRLTPAVIHLESEVREHGEQLSREFGRPIQGFDVFVEYARIGRFEEREWTYVRKDGSHLTVNLVVTTLSDPAGEITGFLGIAKDVTESKLIADTLRRAKEAAEAASRAKSDFLANMSHEIRTPMNAIIGMTELVLGTDLPAAQREYLTLVLESGESLLAIINQILDFSKIEAGKIDLEDIPFRLRDCLGDATKSVAVRAHYKGLELVCHVAPDVPDALRGDPNRLRQIVVNLLGNAIKFTEQGEILLDVMRDDSPTELTPTEPAEANAQSVALRFAVSDTGIGIPAEKYAAIFAAFEQADNSTTRRYGGTGLGLAISSRLVALMNGRLWIESEVGTGSTFYFVLRLLEADPQLLEYRTALPRSVEGLRVLVVDDNATNRRILAEMLMNRQMRPTAVANAAEALQAVRHAQQIGEPYALILTDVHMPDFDGFALAEQLRREPPPNGTLIMMLTSGDRLGDRSRSEQLGIAAYLVKPLKQSELFDAIVAALGTANTTLAETGLSATRPTPVTRSLTILLAEDSVVNQKLAIGLLTAQGHRVTVVNNGREAVAAVTAERFDMLLMDVSMPEMDGLEATAAIRAAEGSRGTHVPIIAMTAHAMKGDRERCLTAGMDGYVAKPIRAIELFATMQRVLDASPPVAAVAEPVPDEPQPAPRATANDGCDWSYALQSVNGDERLLKLVASTFRIEEPKLLDALRNGIAQGDAEQVRRLAHTLKGNGSTFGATRVVETAWQLEQLAHTADLRGASELLGTLEQRCAALCRALQWHEQDGPS